MLNERSFTSEGLEISRASLSSLRRHPPPAGPVMRAAEGRWPGEPLPAGKMGAGNVPPTFPILCELSQCFFFL